MIPRAPYSLIPALFAILATAAGCKSSSTDSAAKQKPALSKESFDELIAKGALRPVDAMTDEGALKGAAPDTDAEAFARAAAKLGESRKEATPPSEPATTDGFLRNGHVELPAGH